MRDFLQDNTSEKEGHIQSSLGVTELSVALHYTFDTPHDILIWDVGHQAYVHKLLTGRKDAFHTNRQQKGLSGFTSRAESPYDPFGTGHSSTSLSAAAGFALAQRIKATKSRQVVAVIGDGALTGGMSFEALNQIGEEVLDILIILNDNKSSIDENRGALAQRDSYRHYFSSLGINYLGECDGHELPSLLANLETAKNTPGPRLLRVNTTKGQGRRTQVVRKKLVPGFQQVFAKTMTEVAQNEERLVLISPAMLSGGGFGDFAGRFPDRCYDVGIAEQHAVTLAAGLAADGMLPVVHLYSTFAQRAYDQVIHDVALQGLPVIFAIDRAGLVGADGSTHHGVFDPGFFNTIPNLRISAPATSRQLSGTLKRAVGAEVPCVIRFPKAQLSENLEQKQMREKAGDIFELQTGRRAVVFSFGAIAGQVQQAAEGLDMAHYQLNSLKPFPHDEVRRLGQESDRILTVEENSARGGLGDTLRASLAESGIRKIVQSRSLPDQFIEHGSRDEQLAACQLNAKSLRSFFTAALRH